MRSKVLYIPAWFPCSFFKEQIDIMRGDCDVKILTGKVEKNGIRKGIKYYISHKPLLECKQDSDTTFINLSYIQHLRSKLYVKQIENISNAIGNEIVKLYDGEKPDVIHIQSISDVAVFVTKWAKENAVKVILTEHILFVRHEINRFARLRENLYNEVDHVMCVSNYLYRNLLTSGFHPKKISVIGNLVNDKYVSTDIQCDKNGRVLFVANHYHDKGLDILLQVVERLKAVDNIVVDVIGLDNSSLYNPSTTMWDEIARRGIEDKICLLGTMSHDDLLQIYSKYSLLLSTSRSETFGLAVAESLMYGTPVVCTDSGGVRDFVNERNGIIVGINDVDALVNAILSVLNNEVTFNNCSQKLCEQYGYIAFRERILGIY